MPVTQYIGARYMPIFADPPEHSTAKTYEPLTIVLHEGNSYTSKQVVPVGIEITDERYWVETGNYNAQVEAYRRETLAAKETADEAQETATTAQNDINALLPKDAFSAENNVKRYIDSKSDIKLELYGITYSLDAGAFAQTMIYVGNRLFAFGDGINNSGVMCEISTLTGAITARYSDSRIGHPNGACVLNGYIYLTNGNKTVYKINPDSLRIESGTTFEVSGPINNLFSDDTSIYAIVDLQDVLRLDMLTGNFEKLYAIEKYDLAMQGSVYVDNRIYVAYTQPNMIRVIDFTTGVTLENKIIPDGDGVFPCNEVESLIYKDGKMLVCAASYINGGYNPQLVATAAFIFDSNILGNITNHNALSKNIAFNNIIVNSNETSRFKPSSMNFNTALVASIIASYHKTASIAITNVTTEDVIALSFGKYSIWHYGSGDTTLKSLYLKNATATIENLTISDVCTITDSVVNMTLVDMGGNITIFNSNINKNLGTFTPSSISVFRHSIAKMDMQAGSNVESIVARVPAPNQNNVKFYIANNAGVPNIAFINYTNLTCFAYIQLVHEIPFIIKPSDAVAYVNNGELVINTANATYPKIKFTRNANAMVSTASNPNVFDTSIDLSIMCTSELR